MADKISYDSLFDLNDKKQINELQKVLKEVNKDFTTLVKNAKQQGKQISAAMDSIAKSSSKVASEMSKLNPAIQKDKDEIVKNNKAAKDLSNTYTMLSKRLRETAQTEKQLITQKSEFTKKSQEFVRLQKEEERLSRKLALADSQQAQNIQKLRLELANKNKEMKKAAKESLGLVNIYQKESQRLNELRTKYKNMALQQGVNTKQTRALHKEITILDAKLKKVDASVGQNFRNIGNYRSAMGGAAGAARQLAAALGFTGVIFALVGAVTRAVKIFTQFEKKNAELAGVLGKTRAETKELREESKRLGSQYPKTSSEVVDLQINLARLGFTQEQVISSTEGIILGAIALNSELGETAQLTGAVVRSFDDLSAADAEEILDKMTVATQQSSNSFETLSVSIPKVAGAANAMGISFDQMLSQLSIAQDATQEASTAGTSLRMIYIKLAESGMTMDQALNKINGSQNKLNASAEIFGARAAVTALALANNTKRANQLNEAISDSGGTMQKVADEQMKTLALKIEGTKSAWEGFVLSVEEGEGSISSAFKTIADGATGALRAMTAANDKSISWGEALAALVSPLSAAATDAKLYAKEVSKAAVAQEEASKKTENVNHIFEAAMFRGIDTMDEFLEHGNRIADFFPQYSEWVGDHGFSQEMLNAISEKYNDILREEGENIEDTAEATKGKINILKEEIKVLQERRDEANSLNEIQETQKLISLKQQELASIERFAQGELKTVDAKEKAQIAQDKLNTKIEDYIVLTDRAKAASGGYMSAFTAATTRAARFFDKNVVFAVQQGFADIQGTFSNLGELTRLRAQEQIDQLDAEREQALEAAGENADARQAVEEAFDKKKEKIEKKAARRRAQLARIEKAAAIANITIDTARAVMRTAAFTPYPLNIPLTAAVAALGATQLAVTAATPIPAFAEGTENAPGGAALVGEQGREIIYNPKTQKAFLTPDSATLMDVPQGSKVLTNAITENILNNPQRGIDINESAARSMDQINSDRYTRAVIKGLNKQTDKLSQVMRESITSIPLNKTVIDERGVRRFIHKKGTIVQKLNTEYSTGGEG